MADSNERKLYAKFRRSDKIDLMEGFLISNDRERAESWKEDKDGDGSASSKGQDVGSSESDSSVRSPIPENFESLTQDFLQSVNMFYRLAATIATFKPLASLMELDLAVYRLVKSHGTLIKSDEPFELYELDGALTGRVTRAADTVRATQSAWDNLPNMLLMGLISSYDAFLAKVIRVLFLVKPELLSSSERSISLRELAELGSVEAARELVVEKEIEVVIRKSHHEQIGWLEGKLGITLTKDLDIWPHFIEICERRNLFTHTGGKVSTQYLSVCRAHKVELHDAKVDDQLAVDMKYLRRAILIVSELGLKLVQVVWRKLQPDRIDEAAASLNNVGFDLISRRRYKLASTMLHFGLHVMKKHGSDQVRKMMVINYANSEKMAGQKEKAIKILEEEDWSAVSDNFKVCIAAVKDDVQTVLALMEGAVRTGQVRKQDFREWPVFSGLRDDAVFSSEFEKLFGEPLFSDKESAPKGDDVVVEEAAQPQVLASDGSSSSIH